MSADLSVVSLGKSFLDLQLVGPSWPPNSPVFSLGVCYSNLLVHCVRMFNPFSAEIHASARRNALSKFTMPAMSPTMTEGGIAQWKVKEGQKYSAGDVLLEIVRIPVFASRVVYLTFLTRKLTKLLSTWRRRKMVSSQKSW